MASASIICIHLIFQCGCLFLINSSGSTPTLSLGIAHNYGAIWDISWCPSGTWEPKSSNKDQVQYKSNYSHFYINFSKTWEKNLKN